MATQAPYDQQTLNIRAAEFYKSIRKDKSNWHSIVDLSPVLAEFKHYIAAGVYEKAFHVYDEIFGYLGNWSENQRLIEMGEELLEKRLFGKQLPEHMIMRITTYICWGYNWSGQIDKARKAALETKIIGEKLLEKESSDDYSHSDIHNFMTIANNLHMVSFVYQGRHEKVRQILEESEEQMKNVESARYQAKCNNWHGFALIEMGDERALEILYKADRLFDEIEEETLDAFFLGEKELAKLTISSHWPKIGQIKAGYEAYEESLRIQEKINGYLHPMVAANHVGPNVRYLYRFAEARKIAKEGVSIAEKAEHLFHHEKNAIYMVNLLRDEGLWNIYINKSKSDAFSFFQAAIDTMQKCVEMANTLGIIPDIAMLHGKIGNIYCHLGHGDPGLFRLAEENLEKALDLWPTVHGEYNTNLDLGRLYVFWAGKIYKDGSGKKNKDARNKMNQANEHFTWVYENAEKDDGYRAKAAFGLGVVALETALVEKLKKGDRKKKFNEAWEKFNEANELFEKRIGKVKKEKFLSGKEAEKFTKKYKEQPIDLRKLAEMQYGQAVALVGLLICADEYPDKKDLGKKWFTDKRKRVYDQAFKQVPSSPDFLRDIFRDRNMLRVSLAKEDNIVKETIDENRKVVIETWLEKNEGIEDPHEETAELKWGFTISKNEIDEFLADKKKK